MIRWNEKFIHVFHNIYITYVQDQNGIRWGKLVMGLGPQLMIHFSLTCIMSIDLIKWKYGKKLNKIHPSMLWSKIKTFPRTTFILLKKIGVLFYTITTFHQEGYYVWSWYKRTVCTKSKAIESTSKKLFINHIKRKLSDQCIETGPQNAEYFE